MGGVYGNAIAMVSTCHIPRNMLKTRTSTIIPPLKSISKNKKLTPSPAGP
jgi:hypothetical protein